MKCSIFISFIIFSFCVALSTQASIPNPRNRRNKMNRFIVRRNPENLRQRRLDGFGFPPSVLEGFNGGGVDQGFDGGVNGGEIIVPIGGVNAGGINPGGLNQGYIGGVNPGGLNNGGVNPGGLNNGGVWPGGNGGGVQWPGGINPGGPNIPYTGDDDDDCNAWEEYFGLCVYDEDDGDDSHDHDDRK